jgi:hypothetical protein
MRCTQGYYNAYQRNAWLTEWALADFGNATNDWTFTFPTYAQQVAIVQATFIHQCLTTYSVLLSVSLLWLLKGESSP